VCSSLSYSEETDIRDHLPFNLLHEFPAFAKSYEGLKGDFDQASLLLTSFKFRMLSIVYSPAQREMRCRFLIKKFSADASHPFQFPNCKFNGIFFLNLLLQIKQIEESCK